jgi:hypothetical protein
VFAEDQANRPRPSSLQKIATIVFFLEIARLRTGELQMRIATTIFAGLMAALTLLASPALAKHSDAPKAEDKPAASACTAYQPAADGSWKPLPCEEGSGSPPPHKSAARSTDEHTR